MESNSSFIPSSVRDDDVVGRWNITLRGSLSLRDALTTSTLKQGNAGNITIDVDGLVSFCKL